ncbi:MAG: beta-glucosidase [Muribaculaceae bacterium]|nr:beta-glucosidase [Muribaculaceae bacterium]
MQKTLTIVLALIIAMSIQAKKMPRLGHDPIDKVIAAMTLEEKALLSVGTGMSGADGESAVVGATQLLVPGAAGTTHPIERLGIPAIVLADGPAGLRINPTREGDTATYYCTHFPIGTLLACTWDTVLVENVGRAIGDETLRYGVDVLLAPALNIHRNPLCGRNFEYYSEDPIVAGHIAAAYVRGVQSNGVGTSIKHFAANNQETNRTGNDSRLTPRVLREIYLKGFEIALRESNPWTVMSSYNYINGTYASESHELLETLLRDEWGYDGLVMTDWYGGKDCAKQVYAGNDLMMPGKQQQYDAIIAAVKAGKLDESVLDRNVRRILQLIVRSPRFSGYAATNDPDLKAHAAITRQSATDGMVLLKNDDSTLPLSPDAQTIALYGCTSYDWIPGGTGSGNVNRAYTVSLLEGLENAGYTLADPGLAQRYQEHIAAENKRHKPEGEFAAFYPTPRPEEMNIGMDELERHAEQADVAIVTIGRNSGEFFDRNTADFFLSDANRKLLADVSRVFHAKGKKVVVILNIGGVIETASWQDDVDAILCAWQGGQEGGNSVVDVISGKAYPSGKLTMTFPLTFTDHASTANFPLNLTSEFKIDREETRDESLRNFDYTPYEEDVYVGYRYFDSFNRDVNYPFGYGLGYTTFEYADPQVTLEDDGQYSVSVDVRNTCDKAGREVVQLYAIAPRTKADNKPAKELKAFAKTNELQPGETTRVTMKFATSDLASLDEPTSAWVVAPGTYKLLIAASSRDIRHTLPIEVAPMTIPVNPLFQLTSPLNTMKR